MTVTDNVVCPYCQAAHGSTFLVEKRIREEYGFEPPKEMGFFQCSTCDLIFVWPLPASYLAQLDAMYRNVYNVGRREDPDAYVRAIWRNAVGLRGGLRRQANGLLRLADRLGLKRFDKGEGRIAEFVNLLHRLNPGTLLDVGCSFGDMVVAARSIGVDAYGLEPTQSTVDACERVCPNRIYQGTFPESSGPKARYDLVLFSYSLIYMAGPSRALMEAARDMVNPGGHLVVFSYNGEDALAHPDEVGLHSSLTFNYMTEAYYRYVRDDLGFAAFERVPTRFSPLESFNVLTAAANRRA